MGFGTLRVLNDDHIAPTSGFDLHGHSNMEIITIMLAGELTHTDTMGHTVTIQAGDVQVMTAGTGVRHAEHNLSKNDMVHLLQIWIEPRTQNTNPRYTQRSFPISMDAWRVLVSPDGASDSLAIGQDAWIVRRIILGEVTYQVHRKGSGIFIFVMSGSPVINNMVLYDGDSVEITETDKISITSSLPSDVLLIETPM